MTTRHPRYNSRSKPALDFSTAHSRVRQAKQTTLSDDVEDFANLRSGPQRNAIKQDREVEIVDDDDIKEVKPTRTEAFAGKNTFVDELLRPPLRRRQAGKTRQNVSETLQDESSSDNEGLSSVTKREQEDIKRAIMLSRQEEEKEKKKQLLLFEKFSSSKLTADKKQAAVVIPSTDDEDLQDSVVKHKKTMEGSHRAVTPELFSSQTVDCDQDEVEVEEFQTSPTVPCGIASSCKRYSSTSVGNSPSKFTTSAHSENTIEETVVDINAKSVTQDTDTEPWLTAGKAEKKRLKLKKKQESQSQQQKSPTLKKTPTSSEETSQQDCTTTRMKRKAVHIKVEPSDDPPHKKRYITVENLLSSEQTTDEPIILVLDDDDDDDDDEIDERTKPRTNTTYRRRPQIQFERCYKKTPPLPRTAKEAYKAGLYFAPPGVCSREYSPYIMKLFKMYSTKLHRVQSRVVTRIPWGSAIVCGPKEINSLDYKTKESTVNTSGLDLEMTRQVGMPVKPLNSRKRSLRSHTRSKNSASVTWTPLVHSDSDEELRSYLDEKPSADTQNSWKNLLKSAETSTVFDASTIAQPSKSENTCSDQGKLTSKLNTDPGVGTREEEEITKTTASSEIPLGSDTEKYEINTSSFKSVLKKKMVTTSSDSCQTFAGVSLKEVNVLDASPDCSPVCQPKAKKKVKRKNIESSSDEDSETDLPAFCLQVPNAPEQKQQEEDKPFPRVKDGSKIEIKISPLDTDNIHSLLAAITSSPTISKVCSADSTTDAQFTAKQSSSVMSPQGEQTVTNISEEPVPTFQRSPINSRDRSPRSEKSAKLAAAAEARMRKQNLEVLDTRSDSIRSSSVVDLTESLHPNRDRQQRATIDNLATPHVIERECPLCYKKFSESEIMIHAANCNGLPTEELQSNETKTTKRNVSEQPLLNSPRRQKLLEMKVVLRRSPVADRKAREKRSKTYSSKTSLDFSSVETETEMSELSPRGRAVSVSSDDDSVTSGITSTRELRPRRAVSLNSSEPETEERNGSQSEANSQTHSKLSTRCRDI